MNAFLDKGEIGIQDIINFPVTYRISTKLVDETVIASVGLDVVMTYWEHLRNGRFAPALKEFRLEKLPPPIIQSTAIYDIMGPPFDFRYRFFGSTLVATCGQELTGRAYFADNIQGFGYVNAEQLPIVVETKAPIFAHTVWKSKTTRLYDLIAIRLPLSEDGETVTNVVVCNAISRQKP